MSQKDSWGDRRNGAQETTPPLLASSRSGLSKIIHERSRLALLAYLAVRGSASFAQIKGMLSLSDGNLATHLRVLENAGFVQVRKETGNRRRKTTVAMTLEGKSRFGAYLDELETVILRARSGLSATRDAPGSSDEAPSAATELPVPTTTPTQPGRNAP